MAIGCHSIPVLSGVFLRVMCTRILLYKNSYLVLSAFLSEVLLEGNASYLALDITSPGL